jgi:hypothetical protein
LTDSILAITKQIESVKGEIVSFKSKIADMEKTLSTRYKEIRKYSHQQQKLARMIQRLRWAPEEEGKRLPMELGNILRAAESLPGKKYGLEAVNCWPHLWLLLPEPVQKELTEARANLDTVVRICFWGILTTIVWTYFTFLALPAGLFITFMACRQIPAGPRSDDLCVVSMSGRGGGDFVAQGANEDGYGGLTGAFQPSSPHP